MRFRADWKVHKKVCGKLKPPSTQHDPPSYNAGGPYSEPKDLGSPTNQPPRDTTINKAESVQGLQGVVTSLNNEVLESASRPYTIRAIAGKGKGLVATRKIAKGKWILSELPIFTLPKRLDIRALEHQVAKEVESLNDDHRRAFFDLTNIHGNAYSQPFGIAKTNALPLGSNASSVGLFLDASRINHSCRHNAQNNWNENIGRLTIHALRDIEEGQEITIHYMGSTGEYEERQRFLREKFRFDCKCQLCSLPLAQRNLSDARLREIQVIDRVIGEFCRGGDFKPETALKLLHRMFRLFDEESIWDASIARAYKDAYDIARCIENGGESRARVFAERTYAARCVAEGNDSPVAQKMKQAAEELSSAKMPQGMNDGEFKNWLWMLDG
ncbi:SET domain-containing protein [Canariomyces notabilis]|uniref:SET domain-containing protein n=1 Tax=Canariomyces notabilis TaxID=2074819 RepID=A0AAN6YSY0_9PEZI|nr:SET domain-containing protein [Canariomyces arenarius]